jgi:hypothetical protein
MQLSAVVGSHAMHAAPPAPQAAKPDWTQPCEEQQPLGQDAGLHSHVWFTHCNMGPHAALTPHWHTPMLLQLSAVKVLHTVHAEPPNPHESIDRMLHIAPEQQPVVHVMAHPVHTPDAQLWPPGQLLHMVPPLPHALSVLPPWHWLLAQHPDAHELASHTHAPLRQCWPVTHAAPPPHLHAPVAEQESDDPAAHAAHAVPGGVQAARENVVHAPCEEQHPLVHEVGSQVQTPWEQCRPVAHAGAIPHLHVPLESHVSAAVASQLAHVVPAAPHACGERGSHVVPLQHPPEHEVASHPLHAPASVQTQAPPTQLCPGGHERPPAHAGPRLP